MSTKNNNTKNIKNKNKNKKDDDTTTTTPVSSKGAFLTASEGARQADINASLTLARKLLESGAFIVTNKKNKNNVLRFRFVELEVYAHLPAPTEAKTEAHEDPYAHCDIRQLYGGALYFHRVGTGDDAYKGGSYKGMDVTAGGGPTTKAYVGMLVRAIEHIPDDNDGAAKKPAIIDGPSLVVDTLIKAAGADSIKSYVDSLQKDGDALLAPKVPSAYSTNAPIRVEFIKKNEKSNTKAADDIHDSNELIVTSARVGLSTKKAKDVDSSYWDYIFKPYRLVRHPTRISKGRPHIVCSLLFNMLTASGNDMNAFDEQSDASEKYKEIAVMSGVKESVIKKYHTDMTVGRKKAIKAGINDRSIRDPFMGLVLNTQKLCELHGTLLETLCQPQQPQSEEEEEEEQSAPTKKAATSKKKKKIPPQDTTEDNDDENNNSDGSGPQPPAKKKKKKKTKITTTSSEDDDDDGDNDAKPPAKKKQKKNAPSKNTNGDDDDDNVKPPAKKKQKKEEVIVDTSGLNLKPLFDGAHGSSWMGPLMEVLTSDKTKAADYIGPNRDNSIMPVRELTFQAIKPNPPAAWRLITFGQSPYPRIESATGIAHFDNQIDTWKSKAFGKAASMRCLIKLAAMHKYGVGIGTSVDVLRSKLDGVWDAVTPPQWFEAMLSQGVLLLNAALTLGGSDLSKAAHVKFWTPVVKRIVREILEAKVGLPKGHEHRGVLMLWWGNDSLKVKKSLQDVFDEYKDKVPIEHIEHYNPAAQGELFCKGDENHFTKVNKVLRAGGQKEIDWLPSKDWLKANVMSAHSSFISETQDLHKMYLERLQAGLSQTKEELKPIVGVLESALVSLPDAVFPLKNGGLSTAATLAVKVAAAMGDGLSLDKDEKGAIYLYTTNSLYSKLNAALRDPDRSLSVPYFRYLRLFIEAYEKLQHHQPKKGSIELYRGIGKDLTKEYAVGSVATWWSVSSCTPNINVAKAFGGEMAGGTLFKIKSKTAVPIMNLSAYQNEEEYILSPGTRLKVLSVVKKAGKASVICLEEIADERLVS